MAKPKKFSIGNSLGNQVLTSVLNESNNIENDVKKNNKFKLMFLDPNKIIPSDKNIEIYGDIEDNNFNELLESVKEKGILQPLLVQEIENEYHLIAGHRRREAAIKLQLETVPCAISNSDVIPNDEEMLILLIHANIQREKNDFVKAEEAKRLKDFYAKLRNKNPENFKGTTTTKKVAEDLGLSETQAKRLLSLNNLVPELKKLVEIESLSTSSAQIFAQLSKDSQLEICELINNKKSPVSSEEAVILKNQLKEKEKAIKNINDQKLKLEKQLKKKTLQNDNNKDIEIIELTNKISLLENELKEKNNTKKQFVKQIEKQTKLNLILSYVQNTVNEIKDYLNHDFDNEMFEDENILKSQIQNSINELNEFKTIL